MIEFILGVVVGVMLVLSYNKAAINECEVNLPAGHYCRIDAVEVIPK